MLPGILLLVLGFAAYGAAASPINVIGLSVGVLGAVLLVAGLVRSAAGRRRANRDL